MGHWWKDLYTKFIIMMNSFLESWANIEVFLCFLLILILPPDCQPSWWQVKETQHRNWIISERGLNIVCLFYISETNCFRILTIIFGLVLAGLWRFKLHLSIRDTISTSHLSESSVPCLNFPWIINQCKQSQSLQFLYKISLCQVKFVKPPATAQ